MKKFWLLLIPLFSGCQTLNPNNITTADVADLYDVACLGERASHEVRTMAANELRHRGYTCQEIYQQRLSNFRAAYEAGLLNRPVPSFTPQTPYVMPTQQPSYSAPAPVTTHGTLMGQRPTTSASGQAAYVCQYRTGSGTAQVIQIASDGPCPPTANLR